VKRSLADSAVLDNRAFSLLNYYMKTILSLVLIISLLASCEKNNSGCGSFLISDTVTNLEGKTVPIYKYCDSSTFTIKIRIMLRSSDDSLSSALVERIETGQMWDLKVGDNIPIDSMGEISTHYQNIEGYKRYLKFIGPEKRFGTAMFVPVTEH
jgi:hypothetical protein